MINALTQQRTRSGYSDQFKAAALTALAINHGNATKTAKLLHLPPRTIRAWGRGRGISPTVKARQSDLQKPLVEKLEELLSALIDGMGEPEKIKQASPIELARVMDVVVDCLVKMRGSARACAHSRSCAG